MKISKTKLNTTHGCISKNFIGSFG